MKNDDITWGKKMIKVSVHFWTNNLPHGTDDKTAWGGGAIHMMANKQRGLKHNHVFFNSMDEFIPKLQELLKRNEVRLIKQPDRFIEVDLSKLTQKS
jgi:hypothetical protein